MQVNRCLRASQEREGYFFISEFREKRIDLPLKNRFYFEKESIISEHHSFYESELNHLLKYAGFPEIPNNSFILKSGFPLCVKVIKAIFPKEAQEISELSSQIVQSPNKLKVGTIKCF
jgi:hypothetical protein